MRRNRRSCCLFVVLLLPFCVRAQTLPAPSPTPLPSSTPSLEKQFFKNILHDQAAIWTAPTKLDKSDAKWMIPAGIGTMALITTDRITGDEIAEADRLKTPSRILSYPGSYYGIAAVAGSFYFIGRSHGDSRARETGILTAEASINSLIVEGTLKGISQRARPADGVERSEFLDGGTSFPSGHSTQAWAVATVIANEYHDRRLVQVAAYGIASVVSVARFTGGKHYLSDVLVGSALGYGIGKYVYNAHHRDPDALTQEQHSSQWPAITANVNRRTRQYGIGLTWSF